MSAPEGRPTDSLHLLRRASAGDEGAESELYDACYSDLHARAGVLMRNQGAHTLQATALVHEAWMKLSLPDSEYENRRHFLRAATKAMRCVLVDHARSKLAEKRGAGALREELVEDPSDRNEPSWRMIALGNALEALEESAPAEAQVAHLRIFGGLSHAEIAELLEVAERTVERYWAAVREKLAKVL